MSEAAPLHTRTVGGLAITVATPSTSDDALPPLLFIHGMNGGAWYWERYQRFFAEHGWTSWALDLRGHHASRPVAQLGRVPLRAYVDDALAVARTLAREHAVPAVVGHSMGGIIAQGVAACDTVRALVLIAAVPPRGIRLLTPELALRALGHVGAFLASTPFTPSRREAEALLLHTIPEPERAEVYARLVPESARAALTLATRSLRVDARDVRCPVLVVSALEDRLVVPRVARRIAAHYEAPLLEYAGHGHLIVAEPGWERPASDIERWLRSAVAPGRDTVRQS
ncbi:MAG TPA: alpha/beta fold hydrolase [Gemmatimonadaceae bacterium]|nr:alpha/beta fold hydrolase [Gemmatimonadaceae bacterium]